jgi:hypothetical protein
MNQNNGKYGSISRGEFLRVSALAGGGLVALPTLFTSCSAGNHIRWTKQGKLFSTVSCDGEKMSVSSDLLNATIRIAGSHTPLFDINRENDFFKAELKHRLLNSGAGVGENVLEAKLLIKNTTNKDLKLDVVFFTTAQPSTKVENHRAYIPLSAAGLFNDLRFASMGVKNFYKDCDQLIGKNNFTAHYLEPMASYSEDIETKAVLLTPVIDFFDSERSWRIALFTKSDQPIRFSRTDGKWLAGREITIPANGSVTESCWLLLHTGDASAAWRAFQKFGHHDEYAVPDWVREMKVHYYDFLSSADGQKGRRGNGYESDLQYFREFHVGMATQHGYYPAGGDFLHPDRKTWQAMKRDKAGAAEMSIEKIKARIKATRAAGSKAAIYMHASILDDGADCFHGLKDSIVIDKNGQPVKFGWDGPDMAGTAWRASLASELWRNHLLQQATWIMEILEPDAIVMDETFTGIGYDNHPNRSKINSPGAIDFFKKIRAIVKSFGKDKAFFTSDCSMAPFVLWADGEAGDHAYAALLGNPLYIQKPIRYLSALGNKPWRPCAWHFQKFWKNQVDLAKEIGSGVGISNGWIEYDGLSGLKPEFKEKFNRDVNELLRMKGSKF